MYLMIKRIQTKTYTMCSYKKLKDQIGSLHSPLSLFYTIIYQMENLLLRAMALFMKFPTRVIHLLKLKYTEQNRNVTYIVTKLQHQSDTSEQQYAFLLLVRHQTAIYTELFSCSIINGRKIKQRLRMYQTAKNMQRACAMALISFFIIYE